MSKLTKEEFTAKYWRDLMVQEKNPSQMTWLDFTLKNQLKTEGYESDS